MIQKSAHQTTDTLLMIEPVQFGFNHETFGTNSFQHIPTPEEQEQIQAEALREFQGFVKALERIGVTIITFKDTTESYTPDSIFPNNWISTHETGQLYTYPMAAPNRRNERRMDIVNELTLKFNLEHVDLSSWEDEDPPRYLEGTGGMIFDRTNRICYAAMSPRTYLSALEEFCTLADFELVNFIAFGSKKEVIYHTNVMLSVGETFVCIGMDTVAEQHRDPLRNSIHSTGKEIIEFTNEQIYSHFAGNMLQVRNEKGERILVMSERIFKNLSNEQESRLRHHNDHLLPISIPTIEKVGGGSVRCMLAEIFEGKQGDKL